MKIGNHLRDQKNRKIDNKKKVEKRKAAKQDEIMALPITTKLIGDMVFDSDLNNSRMSQEQKYRTGHAGMRRGQSQGTTAINSKMTLNRSNMSE